MHSANFLGFVVAVSFACGTAAAQSFVNLDFESATVAPTPVGGSGGTVDPAIAFPGWSVGIAGSSSAPQTLYNNLTLGTPAQSLIGPAFPNSFGLTALSGSYSAFLAFSNPTSGTAALMQTGTVPAGTQSIRFLALPSNSAAVVSLGGTMIPILDLGGGNYGGDVTAFAGQTLELRFAVPTGSNSTLYFDAVQFSSQPVPEPATLTLAAAAGALWLIRRRRNARSS